MANKPTVGELVSAIESLLELVDALMPGVRYIALQDYAALNDVPRNARALVNRAIDGYKL